MEKSFVLYWFSGSGNTLWLARVLAAELEGLGCSVRLVPVTDGKSVHNEGEILVFCFPVYSYGMPRLMGQFVSRLSGDNLAAVLCTMGGGAGGTVAVATRALLRQGFRVIGGKAVLMPNNYTAGRVPYPENTARLNLAAKEKMAAFARFLVQGGQEQKLATFTGALSGLANRLFLKSLGLTAKGFKVSPACNNCQVCRRVCPTENIQMTEEKPEWGTNCEQCLRCLHLCPENAVSLLGTARRKRPQYCHPEVKLKDFILRD